MYDEHYESIAELMEVQPHPVNIRRWAHEFSCINGKDNPKDPGPGKKRAKRLRWWGVPSVKDIIAMKDEGWHEGVAIIFDLLERLEVPQVASIRRKRIRGDFGDHLDLQAVFRGELDKAWETTTRELKYHVGLTTTSIFVDISAAYLVQAHEMFWRGAVTVVLADALEKSGRPVRVIAFDTVHRPYQNTWMDRTTSLMLKDYSDPLHLEKMAMVTGLAGFWRYWFWRSWASAPDTLRPGFGYVHHFDNGPIDVDDLPKPLEKLASDEANIVISSIWNHGAAQNFLSSLTSEVYGRRIEVTE